MIVFYVKNLFACRDESHCNKGFSNYIIGKIKFCQRFCEAVKSFEV